MKSAVHTKYWLIVLFMLVINLVPSNVYYFVTSTAAISYYFCIQSWKVYVFHSRMVVKRPVYLGKKLHMKFLVPFFNKKCFFLPIWKAALNFENMPCQQLLKLKILILDVFKSRASFNICFRSSFEFFCSTSMTVILTKNFSYQHIFFYFYFCTCF